MLNLMALKDEIDALTVKRGIGGESGTSVADRVLSQLLRSEEHTSELQSQSNVVCRLLLEKKNTVNKSAQDHHHRLARSAGIFTGATMVSRILRYGPEHCVAALFCSGAAAEAFYSTLRISH